MKIVFAPDSLKGTSAAHDAAGALAAGWLNVRPEDDVVLLPMADGGEGTIAAFLAAVADAEFEDVEVTGPRGERVDAGWVDLGDGTAVVELGLCSGIELLGEDRAPLTATTEGFGQAIVAALDSGAQRLVLGIGSSASTDGGAGLLLALGARILDDAGVELGATTDDLARAASVDLSKLRALPAGGVTVLTDVTNPLLGAHGAAAVFGPQKGATEAEVDRLDMTLTQWSRLVIDAAAAAGLTRPNANAHGAGAAGGTGFALQAWGATSRSGAAAVAELIGLTDALEDADLIVTGEGSFDAQSAAGKVPVEIAAIAARHGVPVALVAGRIAPDADTTAFAAVVSLADLAGSAQAAMTIPEMFLAQAGTLLAQTLARH